MAWSQRPQREPEGLDELGACRCIGCSLGGGHGSRPKGIDHFEGRLEPELVREPAVQLAHREPSAQQVARSEEHTSELQSPCNLVCRLLLEKKKKPPY